MTVSGEAPLSWPWEDDDHVLLDALMHDAPVAFVLYDRDLRYRRINRLLARINDLPVEAHLGRRPSEVLDPDVAAAVEAMLARVLATGEDVVKDVRTVERSTGAVRYWQSQCFPARDPDGGIHGVAVVVVDVTERRRTEDALRRSGERAVRLQQATARLAGALEVAEVAAIVAAVGRETLGARWSSVALRVADTGTFRVLGTDPVADADAGRPDDARQLPVAAQLPWPTPAALATGEAHYSSSPEDLVPRSDGSRPPEGAPAPEQERGCAVVPLVSAGQVLGAVRFAFDRPRVFSRDEQVFCEALAGQCVLAVERAELYEREHTAAVTLARSLLPDRLPDVPGLELAARYLPGGGVDAGGDWYDAFALGDGRYALVVGDVMGKGLAAAAGMGRMRSALRALALAGASPADVLGGLDRLVTATEGDEHLVTLAYAVLDPSTGELVASTAGHLPPLLLRADGEVALLDADPASTPLGVPEERVEHRLRLRPGDRLLAYTDGLVETRERSVGEGLEELLRVVRALLDGPAGAPAAPDDLADVVLEAMTAEHRRDDDVTVLALRVCG